MRIQHNIPAMNSYRNYTSNTKTVAKNLEKLSSGYRINRAGDDAAGLAISEKMRAQITGLETAQKNAKDGISLVQTAEGALTEVHSMLNRMFELSEQSANGTYDNEVDRANLQKEVSALKTEIDRIADSSNFNGIKLLDGSLGGGGAISATGSTFKGAEVAKFNAAKSDEASLVDWTTAGTQAVTAGKDTFNIDGTSITIDWTKGDAKKVFDALAVDHTAGPTSADATKDLASKLQTLFNDALKEAGSSSTIKVTSSGAGKIQFESTSKTAGSQISFIGSDNASDTVGSLGNVLFKGDIADTGKSKIHEAEKLYNGDTLAAATDSFQMTINGSTVKVGGITATKGTTTMSGAAGDLETSIQTAIDDYNTQKGGLGAGDEGFLDKNDFTVEVKDGSFQIKYSGDEDVNFSFNDVGGKTAAASLGLANGSSKAGGNQGLTLQIGDTAENFNKLTVSVGDMHARSLGIGSIDISNQTGGADAMQKIKDAINSVSSTRGDLGATQNRLDHTINNLSVMAENIQDAESSIRDVDVAKEMMAYTKNNILVQSAQAMLAQANQLPQGVLQLLQ